MRIECPKCHFAQDVREDKIPPGAVNARCPQCDERFRLRGSAAEETAQEYAERRKAAAQAYEQVARAEPAAGDAGVRNRIGETLIWEARWRSTPASAFGKTLLHIITRPKLFFSQVPASGALFPPVLFAILVWVLFSAGLVLLAKFQPGLYITANAVNAPILEELRSTPWWAYFFSGIFGFVIASALLVGIAHFSLRMLSPASANLRLTIRVVAYANASWILFFIPQAGALLATVATWVILCVALHAAHRLNWGTALSATAACLFMQMLIALFALSGLY